MIEIKYNGKWPSLCCGQLIVTIEGEEWEFPDYCMTSGGAICHDEEDYWSEQGPWTIDKWPVGFPDKWKLPIIEAVNEQIDEGCCGGCI